MLQQGFAPDADIEIRGEVHRAGRHRRRRPAGAAGPDRDAAVQRGDLRVLQEPRADHRRGAGCEGPLPGGVLPALAGGPAGVGGRELLAGQPPDELPASGRQRRTPRVRRRIECGPGVPRVVRRCSRLQHHGGGEHRGRGAPLVRRAPGGLQPAYRVPIHVRRDAGGAAAALPVLPLRAPDGPAGHRRRRPNGGGGAGTARIDPAGRRGPRRLGPGRAPVQPAPGDPGRPTPLRHGHVRVLQLLFSAGVRLDPENPPRLIERVASGNAYADLDLERWYDYPAILDSWPLDRSA